ncbi:40s ribosomal s8 [Fusarium longipes]|uniref:40s ribosomal s8 n=1 Tax=Fusarium longipes TaxID=694270 RepID=A0A395T5Y6_9HYPO|nr:40s ribosomal s8 [Fusarium longipes]
MNPCAPTFVPTVEDGSTSNDDDTISPSTEKRLSDRKVPLKPHQSPQLTSITIDPDEYDTMFPALQGAQVDGRSVRSPKPVRRSISSDETKTAIEYEKPEYQNADESVDSSSEELEYLKPTVYTPKKKSLEYLKPTVYTPPTSSQERPRRSGVVKRAVRSTNARSRSRSPRHAWRPPTPHPEGKPRGPKSRHSPSPVAQIDELTRYPTSAAYPSLSYSHYYPGFHGQVQEYIDYVPYMMPPMPHLMVPPAMPYTAWPMLASPWPVPMTQPSKSGCPPGCECHYKRAYGSQFNGDGGTFYGQPPPQTYLRPQPQSQPRTQQQTLQQSRPGTDYDAHLHPLSRSSAENDDTKRPSQIRSIKSLHGETPSMSNSVPANTPLKTQVERIKQESRDRQLVGVVCKDGTKREQINKELREAAEQHTKATGFIPTRQVKSAQDSPSVLRAAKINIKRESQAHAQELGKPPQNAPTGPSSTRTLAQSFSATVRKALNLNGSDSGAWSQSKSWTSFATKERQAFQRMMANLRYMSADQSPFVPQSPAELTAFKAALAESKTKKLGQKVEQRLAKTNARVAEGVEDKNEPMMKLLGGRKFEDHLSPVFAAFNCFNKARMKPPYRAEWPSLAELKEEGDKRASRQGRCLPLPRMDFIASRFLDWADEAYNSDGSIRWDKKVVQVGFRYICPVTGQEPSMTPPPELQTDEAPFLPAQLLHDIDAVDSETEGKKEKDKEKKGGKDLKKKNTGGNEISK